MMWSLPIMIKELLSSKNNKKVKKYHVVSSPALSNNVYDLEYDINPSPLKVDRFVPGCMVMTIICV